MDQAAFDEIFSIWLVIVFFFEGYAGDPAAISGTFVNVESLWLRTFMNL
ncbi:hypothetical protein [Dyadobacter alkalitolerans]|nr:hypothetical protein [Dyadobacter alkalitolerans]